MITQNKVVYSNMEKEIEEIIKKYSIKFKSAEEKSVIAYAFPEKDLKRVCKKINSLLKNKKK